MAKAKRYNRILLKENYRDYYMVVFHKKDCDKKSFGFTLDKKFSDNLLIEDLIKEKIDNFIFLNGKKLKVSWNNPITVYKKLEEKVLMILFEWDGKKFLAEKIHEKYRRAQEKQEAKNRLSRLLKLPAGKPRKICFYPLDKLENLFEKYLSLKGKIISEAKKVHRRYYRDDSFSVKNIFYHDVSYSDDNGKIYLQMSYGRNLHFPVTFVIPRADEWEEFSKRLSAYFDVCAKRQKMINEARALSIDPKTGKVFKPVKLKKAKIPNNGVEVFKFFKKHGISNGMKRALGLME